MHPVALYLAGKFAESAGSSFGESFGEALGGALGEGITNALFGGNATTSQVSAALAEMSKQLAEIERKIDNLTSLVEALPDVLLLQGRREAADRAYRSLESARTIYFRPNRRGRIRPLKPAEQWKWLETWKEIVHSEDRPLELVSLPYWTILTRFVIAADIDVEVVALLKTKLSVLKDTVKDAQDTIDGHFATAEKAFEGKYFKSGSIENTAPYVKFVKADDFYRLVIDRDPDTGYHHSYYVKDERENRRRDNKVRQIAGLRGPVQTELDVIAACSPAIVSIERCIERIESRPGFEKFSFDGIEAADLDTSILPKANIEWDKDSG